MLLRTLILGIKSLLLHPMRSALTVLGIFIGVASVIWLLAIGEGISNKAQQQIEELGADNIIVRSIEPPAKGNQAIGVLNFGIKRADQELLENIPTVKQVIPIREVPMRFAYVGNKRGDPIEGRLVGCTPEYLRANRLELARGHFLTDAEATKPVCVIAHELSRKLFPYEDPIQKEILLTDKGDRFKIVGVLKHKTATGAIGGSFAGQNFSLDVYIPIMTMRRRLSDTEIREGNGTFSAKKYELSQCTVQGNSIEDISRTAHLIESTLRRDDKERADFSIIVPYELLEQAKTTRLMFMIFMGLIAAISLVVGGIGIMNIMLATVTERTREIGIRRALGAKKSDIIRQFLVETIVLSVLGGLVGIFAGLLCPVAVTEARTFVETFAPKIYAKLPEIATTIQPEIVPVSIPMAFGVSVVIGVVFGIYPAMRAAKMNPIEALRHE